MVRGVFICACNVCGMTIFLWLLTSNVGTFENKRIIMNNSTLISSCRQFTGRIFLSEIWWCFNCWNIQKGVEFSARLFSWTLFDKYIFWVCLSLTNIRYISSICFCGSKLLCSWLLGAWNYFQLRNMILADVSSNVPLTLSM